MRDAMSLTDQAIAFGQGEVQHADVAAMLGTLDHRHVLALIEALADVDAAGLLAEVAALAEQGPDFAAVLDDVTGVLHRLAIAQMVPDAVDNGHGDREALLALAARFTAEDIQLYYQIGIQGRGDMEHAPDLRTALEMTLLRMLAFRPQGVPRPAETPLPLRSQKNTGGAGDAASSPDRGGEAPAPVGAGSVSPPPATPAPSTPAPATPAPAPATSAFAPSAPAPEAQSAPPVDDAPAEDLPPPWIDRDELARSQVEAPPASVSAPAPAASEPDPRPDAEVSSTATSEPPAAHATGGFGHDDWLANFAALGLGGLTRNLAAHCVVDADDGEQLTLRLDPSQAAMQADVHVTRIREALAAIGVERRLVLTPGALPPGVETPRQQADRLAAQRHAEAIEALSRDPHVQKLQQAFGARLIESTVRPIDAGASG